MIRTPAIRYLSWRRRNDPVPATKSGAGLRLPALGLGASLLLASGGCYNYVVLSTPDPQPGTRVAAELTDSGAAELAAYLGPNVSTVDGQLVNLTGRELMVSVVSVRHRNGVEDFWKGESVTVPRGDIATLHERKLAVGRSVFLVVGGAGAAVALLRAFGVVGTGSSAGGLPPPGQ